MSTLQCALTCTHTHTHSLASLSTHTLSLALLSTLLILSGLENRRIEYRAHIYRYVEIIKYVLEIKFDQILDFENPIFDLKDSSMVSSSSRSGVCTLDEFIMDRLNYEAAIEAYNAQFIAYVG